MLSLLAAAAAAPALLLAPLAILVLAPLLLALTAGAALVRALTPRPPSSRVINPPPLDAAAATRTGAINAALSGLWPTLTATLQASATSALAAALPPLPPPLAWALARTRLTLAGPAPVLDRLAVSCPATEAGTGPALTADASISWAGGVEVGLELVKNGGRPALSAGAAIDGVRAEVRAEVLSFNPGPPSPSATVRLSLAHPPDLAVSTWVGSPLGAGLLPFLDALVEGAVRDAVCGPLLAPGGVEATWPPGGGSGGGGGGAAAIGLVVVDLSAGADLPSLRLGSTVVAVVSIPGGRSVVGSGAGTAAVAGRAGASGAADFSTSPPAVFLIPPAATRGLRVRVALYGVARGGTPLALGSGEVEVEEEDEEGAAVSIPLSKAGAVLLTPRTRAATAGGRGGAVARRPRVTTRLTVARPGEAGGAAQPPHLASAASSSPGADWLDGGLLRVGLGAPPPVPTAPPPPALARLVEVSAAGRTARLGGGGDGSSSSVDLALPSSALSGSLTISAWDWAWAADADTPVSFTRPGPGRTEPATTALPLARLVAAPGGHTAGLFRLAGAPLGLHAAVALEARWVPFRSG